MKSLVMVWRSVSEASEAALAPEEWALLSPSARPKRRAEFTAGRAAARAAAAQFSGVAPASIVILRERGDFAGRPYAATRDGRPLSMALSITHTDEVAVAVAAAEPLGVDVVAHEPLSHAFIDEAFAPGELDHWRLQADDERRARGGDGDEQGDASDRTSSDERIVCRAFAAKEAALKWLGCGMRVPLRSVVVTPAESSTDEGWFRRLRVRVRAETLGRDATLDASFAHRYGRVWMILAAKSI